MFGQLAELSGQWAGIPVPMEGQNLIVAPQMPFAEFFDQLGQDSAAEKAKEHEAAGKVLWKVRNRFWSTRYRATVVVLERDGRVCATWEPGYNHIHYDLQTMANSDVWGIEQESRAVKLLGTMIRHVQFKRYLLTGMFLEQSKRSGVTYVFRRLKPTIALRPWRSGENAEPATILACLCQHPIAYYEGSWAGAMCPTDDVVAHLTMMRGDEALFWRRSTQHPPYRPEAGL